MRRDPQLMSRRRRSPDPAGIAGIAAAKILGFVVCIAIAAYAAYGDVPGWKALLLTAISVTGSLGLLAL